MIIGGGAFRGWLGHGVEPSWWDECPYKETPESSLTPPTLSGHREKMDVYKPGCELSADTEFAGTLSLGIPASRTGRNKCCWSHPVYFCHSSPSGLMYYLIGLLEEMTYSVQSTLRIASLMACAGVLANQKGSCTIEADSRKSRCLKFLPLVSFRWFPDLVSENKNSLEEIKAHFHQQFDDGKGGGKWKCILSVYFVWSNVCAWRIWDHILTRWRHQVLEKERHLGFPKAQSSKTKVLVSESCLGPLD